MIPGKRHVRPEEQPTSQFGWGQIKFLCEPALCNAEHLTVGHVKLAPGQGHLRHNHPGSEEILFILAGEGEQMVETDLEENGGEPRFFPVKPGDLAPLFGTQEQNEVAITVRAREIGEARNAIADFIDGLPEDQFDRASFRATRSMAPETRQQLDVLLYRYQQEKSAMDLAKKRLQLVRSAGRTGPAGGPAPEVDADLLVGQMFGALDQIRLQMSMDLLYLEHLLQGYSQSTRTQEILAAFQSLVELQGDLEGPSPELSSVLDWLQDSSTRRITLNASSLTSQNFDIPRASDLLREAYEGARQTEQ